jgi:sulfatase modifying factor 1
MLNKNMIRVAIYFAVGIAILNGLAFLWTDTTVDEPYWAKGFSLEDAERPQVIEEGDAQTETERAGFKSIQDMDGRSLLLVEKGCFEMAVDAGAHVSPEGPFETVSVRSFFMGQTEVTYGEWRSVLEWAELSGYKFDGEGRGISPSHPVTFVSWEDVVKWCNAKSEKEGLRPCYYTSQAKTDVFRRGHAQLSSGMVAWGASGYRLPTKAEWEKAARGGLIGKRYPNGDTLEPGDAHFGSKRSVGVKEVKSYPPNGYGFYDMDGNVSEWCWDSRHVYRYKTEQEGSKTGNTADPKGPAVGKYRVICGGAVTRSKEFSQIGFYAESMENNHLDELGFRLVRR